MANSRHATHRNTKTNRSQTVLLGACGVVVACYVWPQLPVAAGAGLAGWLTTSGRGRLNRSQHVPSTWRLRVLAKRAGIRMRGKPGGYAGVLARRAAICVVLLAVVATAAVIVGSWYAIAQRQIEAGNVGVWAAAGAAAGALLGLHIRYKAFGEWRRARVGEGAERLTVASLVTSDSVTAIRNGWLPPGQHHGDLDHAVALSNGILLAIETKAGGGQVGRGPGTVTAGGRPVGKAGGDPVAQIRAVAADLRQATGATVEAVVCIPRGRGRLCTAEGVHIVGGQDLAELATELASSGASPDPTGKVALRLIRLR